MTVYIEERTLLHRMQASGELRKIVKSFQWITTTSLHASRESFPSPA